MKKATGLWYKNRRFWLLFSAVLLLGAAALYGIWSKAAWDNLGRSKETKASILRQIETALALPTNTSEEREAKKEALQQTTQTIQNLGSPCYIAEVIVWQQFMGDLKQQQERCAEDENKIRQVDERLRPIITFLQDDATVAQALTELQAQRAEIGEADFAATAMVWERAAQNVRNVEVSEPFLPVGEATSASLEAGVVKWKELIAAHEAKNKAGFLRAQQELAAVSDQLVSTRELEQRELIKLVEAFREALTSTKL